MRGAFYILLLGWAIAGACSFAIKAGGKDLRPSGFDLEAEEGNDGAQWSEMAVFPYSMREYHKK